MTPAAQRSHRLRSRSSNSNVHGGLTYANKCEGEICHVPEPGEPDDVWWFGFDCCHARDLVSALNALRIEDRLTRDWEVYRDLAYARRETEKLAEQLARAGETG